jgi:hypothetical protein
LAGISGLGQREEGSGVGVRDAGTCTLNLPQVELNYHGKTMTLIFNISIERSHDDRRPVIDSVPFQEGTYVLDLSGWSRSRDKMISATRWKKVKVQKTDEYQTIRKNRNEHLCLAGIARAAV